MASAQEKSDLYALDLDGLTWLSAPNAGENDRIEIARLPEGAVALRNPADPQGTVLRYTAAEWVAFVRGARDGEFEYLQPR
ncbi:DUF397 domain-containing protein [Streptomyces sp. NPDC003077]|uniref:DUF397 domain-containing protein n=1 Tax=Streptomyces sp. NPDC003077 TaxID=3154443 RepID=UPI0033B4BD1E